MTLQRRAGILASLALLLGLAGVAAPPAAAAPIPNPRAAIVCTGQNIWHSFSSKVASAYVDEQNSPARLIYRNTWSRGYYATHIQRKPGYQLRLWRQDTNQTMTWTSKESIGYVPMPTFAKPCSGTAITLHFIHF